MYRSSGTPSIEADTEIPPRAIAEQLVRDVQEQVEGWARLDTDELVPYLAHTAENAYARKRMFRSKLRSAKAPATYLYRIMREWMITYLWKHDDEAALRIEESDRIRNMTLKERVFGFELKPRRGRIARN